MSIDPKPVQSWCVILQTFPKKAKKELVGELVRGFGLDEREASDAVSNLPIVLLDNVSLNQAKAVKEKIEVTGSEIEITNHDIIKKQCYRIEWPETPSLVYFDAKSDSSKVPTESLPVVTPTPVKPEVVVETKPSEFIPQVSPAHQKSTPKPVESVINEGLDVGPIEANVDPIKKNKKAWFPFSLRGNKEKKQDLKLPVNDVLVPRPTEKKSSPDSTERKATPAASPVSDLKQTEWQKRTREIQERLEKMGAYVPEANVKPTAKMKEKGGSIPSEVRLPAVKPTQKVVKEKPSAEGDLLNFQDEKSAEQPNVEIESKPVSAAPSAKAVDVNSQSFDLFEKIQNLENELIQKQNQLDAKQAEVEQRSKALVAENSLVEQLRKENDERQVLIERQKKEVEEKNILLEQRGKEIEEKHSLVEQRGKEIDEKHAQVEDVRKVEMTFSQKVDQLQRDLSAKEQHLTEKHSELQQKYEREKALTETVSSLEFRLAEQSAFAESSKQEIARLNALLDETNRIKIQEIDSLQKRMQDIVNKVQALESDLDDKQNLLAQKNSELQQKDQKIQDLNGALADLEKRLSDAHSSEKDKEQQISNFRAYEKELLKKIEGLEKALVEMGEALGVRDESLRQRDEVLVALERRVQDLDEKTGNLETLKSLHVKLADEHEDLVGKYARISEEYRRFKSKNERKTASLTREMGEWVRKVDNLRQGLQKFNQNIVRPDVSEEAEFEADPDEEEQTT